MSVQAKERIFVLVFLLFVALHLDLWGWGRIEPMLFGWIPYHIWYHGLLTLGVALCMIWLTKGNSTSNNQKDKGNPGNHHWNRPGMPDG